MSFFDKVKQIATGKTEEERRQIAAANIEIRKKALAAELREREKTNIMLAEEKIRTQAKAKLKAIQSPKQSFSINNSMNYGSMLGQPRIETKTTNRIKPKYIYIKKGKKYIRKKVKGSSLPKISQPMIQKRWNPIFGGYR
jgi:hypothetical protein